MKMNTREMMKYYLAASSIILPSSREILSPLPCRTMCRALSVFNDAWHMAQLMKMKMKILCPEDGKGNGCHFFTSQSRDY